MSDASSWKLLLQKHETSSRILVRMPLAPKLSAAKADAANAQDGGDHVDAHHSIAFIVAPFAKQGALVSTSYATLNMKTTSLALPN